MATLSEFLSQNSRSWSVELWDGLIRAIEARFGPLEEQLDIQREITQQVVARGLQVIEEGIGPAIVESNTLRDQIRVIFNDFAASIEIMQEGYTPTEPASYAAVMGSAANLTIQAGDERRLFVPSPFTILLRDANVSDYAVIRTVGYDRVTGIYSGVVVARSGAAGPFSDWKVGAIAGPAIAQMNFLNDTLAARQDVIVRQNAIAEAEGRVAALEQSTVTNRQQAQTARESAQAILSDYRMIQLGAQSVMPTFNYPVGAQMLYTGQTPPAVLVKVGEGVSAWAPTVTTSLGGIRRHDFALQEYAANSDFAVPGGFTTGDVYVNGVLLRSPQEVTMTPGESGAAMFRIARAISADEPVSFRGQTANDATDFYTKTETDIQIGASASSVLSTLRDGVAASYNTLKKLYDLLIEHTSRTNNPHGVTKNQVGLGNVDNTSDANKPISTATQASLNARATIESGLSGFSRAIISGAWDQIIVRMTDGSFRKMVSDISNNRMALWWNPAGWPVIRVDMTDITVASREMVNGAVNARVQELRWVPTGVYNYNNAGDSWTGIGGGTPLWGIRIIPENVGGQFYYRPTHAQSTTLQAYREDRGWFTIQ